MKSKRRFNPPPRPVRFKKSYPWRDLDTRGYFEVALAKGETAATAQRKVLMGAITVQRKITTSRINKKGNMIIGVWPRPTTLNSSETQACAKSADTTKGAA